MAKSIRSKIKRKHRAEFRKTLGTEAYNENMKKVQSKLKECVEKQSMNSIERLAETLGVPDEQSRAKMEVEDETLDIVGVEASEAVELSVQEEGKGENKVPFSRKSKRKDNRYRAKNATRNNHKTDSEPKKRPKYFCQF